MSNYLGIPDFIPQLTPFNPDLNYYANVLQAKQSQYNAGLSKVNSVYNSVFNSPMTGPENIARRDQYFKTIEQQVKKVAGMDLSEDKNVSTANSLFDPLLNDKDIINDMVKTKSWHNALETGEQYRNCIDETKCGGSYWDEGMQKIQYEMDDFKNASASERLKMQASKFTPKIDVQKKAFKAIKDAGFDVSSEYTKGGYNITDTNGYLLLGKADKNGKKVSNGILPQFLYGMFGNDAAVQDMYKTQAYVQRRGAVKQIAAERGISEQQAESEYLHNMLPEASLVLEKSKKDLEVHRDKLKVDSDSLEIIAKDKGYGDSVEEAYAKIQELIKNTEPAEAYHEGVNALIKTAPNLNDVNALRNRVDGIVANAKFTHDMDATAYEYAMGTAKHKMEENKYSLAAYNNKLDLDKSLQLKQVDHALRLDLEEKLGHIGGKGGASNDIEIAMQRKGITYSQLAKFGIDATNIKTPAARKELVKQGIFTEDEAKVSGLAFATGGENYTDANIQNGKIYGRAVDSAYANSVNFVKATVKGMQNAYKEADSNPDKTKANTIQNKILNDASDMFKGSGINVQDLLSGNTSLDVLDKHPKLSDITDMMLDSRKKDKAAQVYNSKWSDDDIKNLQIAQQTAQGLMKERESIMKNAVKEVILGMPDKTHVAEEGVKISSMIGEGGQVLPVLDAFKKYWKSGQHTGDMQQELAHYVQGYDDRYKALVGKMKSLDSKAGSQDSGGSTGVEHSIVHTISGDAPMSTNYLDFQSILQEVKDNPYNLPISVVGGDSKDFSDLKENSATSTLANYVIQKVSSGETKGMKISTQSQYLPQQHKVGVKVTVDDEDVRKAMGLKNSDPVTDQMRTFTLALPEGLNSANKFIKKTQLSDADILLQNPGRGLSIEVPQKGSTMLYNKEGKVKGKFNVMLYEEGFDPETNQPTFKKTLPYESDVLIPPVNAEKALDILSGIVSKSYLDEENRKIIWEKWQKQKQLQNARSGK